MFDVIIDITDDKGVKKRICKTEASINLLELTKIGKEKTGFVENGYQNMILLTR